MRSWLRQSRPSRAVLNHRVIGMRCFQLMLMLPLALNHHPVVVLATHGSQANWPETNSCCTRDIVGDDNKIRYNQCTGYYITNRPLLTDISCLGASWESDTWLIDMAYNHITIVTLDNPLRGLSRLQILYLDYNLISMIEYGAFDTNTALNSLSLVGNHIWRLPTNIATNLEYFTHTRRTPIYNTDGSFEGRILNFTMGPLMCTPGVYSVTPPLPQVEVWHEQQNPTLVCYGCQKQSVFPVPFTSHGLFTPLCNDTNGNLTGDYLGREDGCDRPWTTSEANWCNIVGPRNNNGFNASEMCCRCNGGLDDSAQRSHFTTSNQYWECNYPPPTNSPTDFPTIPPTESPSTPPTVSPTIFPTFLPTQIPTGIPTASPSAISTTPTTSAPQTQSSSTTSSVSVVSSTTQSLSSSGVDDDADESNSKVIGAIVGVLVFMGCVGAIVFFVMRSRTSVATKPSLDTFGFAPPTEYKVTFSQKTKDVPKVRKIIEELDALGIDPKLCFYQEHIDDASASHWSSQWLSAATTSLVVPCLLNVDYLNSGPCCSEWNSVEGKQRLPIHTEQIEKLSSATISPTNGKVLMYIKGGAQLINHVSKKDKDYKDAKYIALKIFQRLKKAQAANPVGIQRQESLQV